MTWATVAFSVRCSSENSDGYFVPSRITSMVHFVVDHVLMLALPVTASLFVVIPLALDRLSH